MSFLLPQSGGKIFRGDTITLEFAVNQGGTPVDLTGYSIWFTMKTDLANLDTAPSSIQKTLGSGITIINITAGTLKVVISPDDTARLNADTTFVCDLQIKASTGEISTVADGSIAVSRDVTQSTS